MFKYRIRNKKMLDYFLRNAQIVLMIKPYRWKGPQFGVLSIMRNKYVRITSIIAILRKELKL